MTLLVGGGVLGKIQSGNRFASRRRRWRRRMLEGLGDTLAFERLHLQNPF